MIQVLDFLAYNSVSLRVLCLALGGLEIEVSHLADLLPELRSLGIIFKKGALVMGGKGITLRIY